LTRSRGIENRRSHPKTKPKTVYPVTDATNPGIKALTSKSLLYKTSALKTAPPSGILNILPMPAPRPAATAILLSSSSSLNSLPMSEPKPAAICPAGPSVPSLPPLPIVIDEATALTRGTLALILPLLW
jgi:hypothetical protein